MVEKSLELGCDEPRFLELAGAWLALAKHEPSWSIIAAKYILLAPLATEAIQAARELAERIHALPNNSTWHKINRMLEGCDERSPDKDNGLAILREALMCQKTYPVWAKAMQFRDTKTAVTGRIAKVKPTFYSVQLDVGLLGRLPRRGGSRKVENEQITVTIREVNPNAGFVGLELIHSSDDKDGKLMVGSEHEGVVSGAQAYGVFVQIGEYQGLIHISRLPNLSEFRAQHPDGSPVRVRVVRQDEQHRLVLELADLPSRPDVGEKGSVSSPEVGGEYDGIVTGIKEYGLFVRLGNGHGLLHHTKLPKGFDFKAVYPLGGKIRVRVEKIEGERISLEPTGRPD